MTHYLLELFVVLFATVMHSRQENVFIPFAADEFIVLTQGYSLSRIQLSTNTTEFLPINQANAIAIEYDIKNDCLFCAYYNSIVRQCLANNGSREVMASFALHYNPGIAWDMAYDWMSETLYFLHYKGIIEAVDTSQRRPNTTDYWRRVIMTVDNAGSIAVHPRRGQLYWTNYSGQHGGIYRANLDGTGARLLLAKPFVMHPQKVSVDHAQERIYWLDEHSQSKYIASSDLDAHQIRIHYNFEAAYMNDSLEIAVYDGVIYLSITEQFGSDMRLWRLDTNAMNATCGQLWNNSMSFGLFKVYGAQSQLGVNACADGRHNCTHLCVSAPDDEFSCLCPTGMNMTDSGECDCAYSDELECLKRSTHCPDNHFLCSGDSTCLHE